eukprot:TRINITY_DN60946_c0_g1_i1.p1 TRINITY_DN60946_c0_g1~~TRINITY_DN60946_c0_g1_i1.p1  ORF type:complete len:580 (-),score=78.64 TRINITY_DN60946_c0_g1_i1:330-2069(-)
MPESPRCPSDSDIAMDAQSEPETITTDVTTTTWVANHETDVCMRCHSKFVIPFRRKHHCRRCGEIICSKCSKSREIVPAFHPTKPQRVCSTCVNREPVVVSKVTSDVSARNVPRKDESGKPVPAASWAKPWMQFCLLHVRVIEARGLIASDRNLLGKKVSSDPYCMVRLDDSAVLKSPVVAKTLEPRWDMVATFVVASNNPVLHIELFDQDLLDADDPLGSIHLPIKTSFRSPQTELRGWVQIVGPFSANPSNAGGVNLEIRISDFNPWRHFFTYVVAPPAIEQPLPPFDIDAVYGPSLHLLDLLWTRSGYHVVCFAYDLVFWTTPWQSAVAILLWNVASCFFLPHWPAAICVALAGYALSSWLRGESLAVESPILSLKGSGSHIVEGASLQPPTASGSTCQSDSKDSEMHLGFFAARTAAAAPAWVKELCRYFQPLLRMGADSCEMVHELFTWRHPDSPKLVAGLLMFAIVCELFAFSTVLMFVGSAALLAFSPVPYAVSGLIAYARWRRAVKVFVAGAEQNDSSLDSQASPLESWGMENEWNPAWSSSNYKSAWDNPKMQNAMTKIAASNAFKRRTL